MSRKSRGGTIVATGEAANSLFRLMTMEHHKLNAEIDTEKLHKEVGAKIERDRIIQFLHEKIYATSNDILVGAYEELIKEIEAGTHV